jgi:retron-type reverse transcriptase
MNVTGNEDNCRKLQKEDHVQRVSAEQKGYVQEHTNRRITENNNTDANIQTDNLLEEILHRENMNKAFKRVKSNKGAGGIDGMGVEELLPYLKENGADLIRQIKEGKYKPNPVRRVEIPKEEKGKVRKLGIPTVVDRVVQQAITMKLNPIFEKQFSDNSFGFRPRRNQHDALRRCKEYADDGYVYVIDMDLEKFFDTVCQSKLIEILSRTIKDGRVISLIHKYLNSGVLENGIIVDTPNGVPQGGLCKASHNPPYAKKNIMQSNSHKTNKIVIHGNVTLHNLLFKSQF